MPNKNYHVYADANIYLDFFRFSEDDLAQLETFLSHIDASGAEVYLPQLTEEEYRRNRDKIIVEQITAIKRFSVSIGVPVCARELDSAKTLLSHLKEADGSKKSLVQEFETLAAGYGFKADTLIENLFSKSKRIDTDEELLTAARLRAELKNPPGKIEALGDRVNWESLLKAVPAGQDLHLITRDEDFLSGFQTPTAKNFLVNEWSQKKSGKILVYKNIKSFAAHVDQTLQFANESERQEAIADLAASGSYSTTHNAIAKLHSLWGSFTDKEIEDILSAAMSNSQVGDIMSDSDVKDFYYLARNKLDWFGNPVADAFDEHFDGIAVPF